MRGFLLFLGGAEDVHSHLWCWLGCWAGATIEQSRVGSNPVSCSVCISSVLPPLQRVTVCAGLDGLITPGQNWKNES